MRKENKDMNGTLGRGVAPIDINSARVQQPQKQGGQINIEMEELCGAIGMLEKALEEHIQRIRPVLLCNPSGPRDEPHPPPQPIKSEIAEGLHDMAGRVVRAVADLQEITGRVEL